MLLGLVKQTDENDQGRPIITGRIQMSPVDEVENDYQAVMLSRGPLYGSVVKQPTASEDDEYFDEEQREYASGRLRNGAHGRPEKYEYGRIVEPADREEYERERVEPHHFEESGDFLEAEPSLDEVLTDLDSYQYLDELLPEQRDLWEEESLGYGLAGGGTRPHYLNDGFPLLLNLYRTQEELEQTPTQILEKGQHNRDMKPRQQQYQQHEPQQQQQYTFSGGVKHRNVGGYGIGSGTRSDGAGYNNQPQPKWQHKRSQKPQPQHLLQMQHSIFDQQLQKQQRQQQQQQKQFHHQYVTLQPGRDKLSLANSEATATKHIQASGGNNNRNNNINKLSSDLNANAFQLKSSSKPKVLTDGVAMSIVQRQQQQQQQKDLKESTQQQQQKLAKQNADDNDTATVDKLKAQQQQQKQQKQQKRQQQYKTHQTSSPQRQESFLHPNRKRSGSNGAGAVGAVGSTATNNGYSSMASQMMLRTARGQRQYDVPQIECPTAMDGMERFACPTPDLQGRYRCIDDHVLCDGFIDCPEGEDEDRKSCMFHKTDKAHIDVLADALLRWARGR
uniref:Uncharacterized protein n=2 Tax=Ceratitis capitata TaxID=7213 RepID=W8BHH9_CERCA